MYTSFVSWCTKAFLYYLQLEYRLIMASLLGCPEFEKPLGKPLNEMQVNGRVLTRKYKYVGVWVDLENKKAKIDWKN